MKSEQAMEGEMKRNAPTVGTVLLGAFGLGAFGACASRVTAPSVDGDVRWDAAPEHGESADEHRHGFDDPMGNIVFDSPQFQVGVDLDDGGTTVRYTMSEEPVVGGTWYTSAAEWGTSYSVDRFAAVVAGDLFLVGHPLDANRNPAPSAGVVIEKWKILPQPGTPYARRDPAVEPIGTPAGWGSTRVGIVGGSYLEPDSRVGLLTLRTVLYRGTGMGDVEAVVADPDGRFLLAVTRSPAELVQIDASGPLLLRTHTQLPLLTQVDRLGVWQHVSEGRFFVGTVGDGTIESQKIVLVDSDNDGVFESISTLTSQQWTAAGYDQLASWEDDFVHYTYPVMDH